MFLLYRGMLDKEEVGRVLKAVEGPGGMLKHAYTVRILFLYFISCNNVRKCTGDQLN